MCCLQCLGRPRRQLEGNLRFEIVNWFCHIVLRPSTGLCHTRGHIIEGYNLRQFLKGESEFPSHCRG